MSVTSFLLVSRVRMILVLGYWVLGNIRRFLGSIVILGDIFCCSDTQYNTKQTAVGTVHIPVNDYLVPLLTCTLTDAIICLDHADMLLFIKHNHCHHHRVLGFLLLSLLCYTVVLVLVLGIGIARGQYYWVLDIGCLSFLLVSCSINQSYVLLEGISCRSVVKLDCYWRGVIESDKILVLPLLYLCTALLYIMTTPCSGFLLTPIRMIL